MIVKFLNKTAAAILILSGQIAETQEEVNIVAGELLTFTADGSIDEVTYRRIDSQIKNGDFEIFTILPDGTRELTRFSTGEIATGWLENDTIKVSRLQVTADLSESILTTAKQFMKGNLITDGREIFDADVYEFRLNEGSTIFYAQAKAPYSSRIRSFTDALLKLGGASRIENIDRRMKSINDAYRELERLQLEHEMIKGNLKPYH